MTILTQTPKPNHYPSGLKAGDIICLINQNETVIGKVREFQGESELVEMYKPHVLLVQPSQSGQISVNFMPYGQLSFIKMRDARWFKLSSFICVDHAEENVATHYATFISGLITPQRSSLVK